MLLSVTCGFYLLAAFVLGVAFGTWIGRRVAELTFAKSVGELNGRKHNTDSDS
jgi:hypothetical protein